VSEGLTPAEVGKEIHEHAKRTGHHGVRDSRLTIAEAVVLSVVAIIAAWSGFSAAKWNTESHLSLSAADASTRKRLARISSRSRSVSATRRRSQYRVAWEAWMKTNPFTNPNAPPGPAAMPQYHPTGQHAAVVFDHLAAEGFKHGEHEAATADDYVRTTVILASVLFLIGMISVGIVLLVFAVALILTLPAPHLD